MAVYKATYCYPFLNALDIRLGKTPNNNHPCGYLKCKIDSSNTLITGYKIRLLDQNNNQIFPTNNSEGYISPIVELQNNVENIVPYEYRGVNSGLNGTFLYIPFFQNNKAPLHFVHPNDSNQYTSVNAIYYNVDFIADYIIGSGDYGDDPFANPELWINDGVNLIMDSEARPEGEFQLNGDIINKGQYIFYCNSSNGRCGIYSYNITNDGIEQLISAENIELNNTVVIFKGKYHNQVYQRISGSGSSAAITPPSESYKYWVDVGGNDVILNNDFITYKWEITLYQGSYEPIGGSYRTISYNNLSNDSFDMVLTQGTVLGSTPQRIQIASSDNDSLAVLPSGNSDVLVLQGKYGQLYNNTNNGLENIGDRFYVSNYDSSFGHVYPLESMVNNSKLDLIQPGKGRCQFFEHSNDPDFILDKDIVNYCINRNIDLRCNTGVSVTERRLVPYGINGEEDKPDVDLSSYNLGFTVNTGDLILLTGQTNAYENGVYQVNIEKTGSGTALEDYTGWKRAASFNTWGSYIGRIIYSQFDKKNYQSLAGTGGQLWNPLDSTSGDSILLFVEEKPIVLFGEKVVYSVNVYYDRVITGVTCDLTVDGMKLKLGDLILDANKTVYKVTGVDNDRQICILTQQVVDVLVNNSYCSILTGQVYGATIRKILNSGSEQTDDLSIAYVLQNTTTYTYISPYINLNKLMKLKFNNDLTYSDDSQSKWLKINEINTVLWRVTHKPLIEPLLSYSPDEGIPYKYEVRSFFQKSDENTFYLYETLYLTIDINNSGGDTIGVVSSTAFDVINEELSLDQNDTVYEHFYVETGDVSEPYEPFALSVYMSYDSAIPGRFANIKAQFNQFNQIHWQSYRWVLYNNNGELLQDTGYCYDKTIETTFYGLSNDNATTKNIYFAVLYVIDATNNVLKYMIKLMIKSVEESSAYYMPFNACFDKATHSIKLSYSNYSLLMPSVKKNDIYEAFVSDNALASGFDGSVTYNTFSNNSSTDDNLQITYTDELADFSPERTGVKVPVFLDQFQGDNQYLSYYSNSIGNATVNGLTYENYFTRGSYEADSDQTLLVKNEESNNNQLYYQTIIELDDNFSGQIFDLAVDKDDEGSDSLHISLSVPNFLGPNGNDLNPDRNKIALLLSNNDRTMEVETFLKQSNESDFTTYDFPQGNTMSYILPASVDVDGVTDFGHYNLSSEDGDEVPFFLTNWEADGKVDTIINSSEKFLGNLNLIDEENSDKSKGAPSYWVEDRGTLTLKEGNNKFANHFLHFITPIESEKRYWPNGENEEGYYWNEKDSNTSTVKTVLDSYPEDYNDFMTLDNLENLPDNQGFEHCVAYKRRLNQLNGKQFLIVVKIDDISGLYEQLSSLNPVISNVIENKIDDNNTLYESHIGDYGSICIGHFVPKE